MSAFVNASAVADVVRQATYPVAEIHVGAKFSLDTTRIVGPPAMQDEVKIEVIQPSFVRYDGPEIIDKTCSLLMAKA